jgi:hypothetical protein
MLFDSCSLCGHSFANEEANSASAGRGNVDGDGSDILPLGSYLL